MIRIFIDQPLVVGESVTLAEPATRHLVKVMRQSVGDRFVAFNGGGGEYRCEIISVSGKQVQVEVVTHTNVERESPLAVTLLQGLSRGERMDYSLQKAVELGVTRIMPIVTERTEVRLQGERAAKRLEHWRGVVRHACEQSGRNTLPGVDPITSLADAAGAPFDGTSVAFDPEATHSFNDMDPITTPVRIAIGPEGGFSTDERRTLQAAGFRILRLGPRTLRTETATVAALTALQVSYGDLG